MHRNQLAIIKFHQCLTKAKIAKNNNTRKFVGLQYFGYVSDVSYLVSDFTLIAIS